MSKSNSNKVEVVVALIENDPQYKGMWAAYKRTQDAKGFSCKRICVRATAELAQQWGEELLAREEQNKQMRATLKATGK